jgi:hypothetical protein
MLKESDKKLILKIFSNTLAGCFLVYILIWNLRGLPGANQYFPARGPGVIASIFSIDQYWNMFAPNPQTYDGWYVIPGKLVDGTEVDVYHKEFHKVDYKKPKVVSEMYEDERWRKYLMIISADNQKTPRSFWARYLCNDWNNNNPPEKRLEEFDMYFMVQEMTANGKLPVKKSHFLHQKC